MTLTLTLVWALRARRIVAIVKLRLLNNLTYLLTYLNIVKHHQW